MRATTVRAARELVRRPAPAFGPYLSTSVCQNHHKRHSTTAGSQVDPTAILSRPTWSVRSLLPSDSETTSPEGRITPKQLHHLLRLSALPLPKSAEEEAGMIDVLQSQLLFVREIQSVDTQGVEPLRAIRDETEAGLREATISLDQLKDALSTEMVFGRSRRPRRRKQAEKATAEVDGWHPLQTASQTIGPYFVVRSGKNKAQ